MAKKRSIVKRTKSRAYLALTALLAAGWVLAAYVALANDDVREQDAMIAMARRYLEDKLYIRAANQYREALSTYDTENNLKYEVELLEIYREGGMREAYYGLMEERIDAGRAAPEEYLELAEAYIGQDSVKKAIPILQQGMKSFQDEALTALYESVCYGYGILGTTFTQMRMPASDWCIPAFDGAHWGYVGTNGRMILDFLYEEATCFAGNYAVVRLNGVYTLIDKNGYWNAVDKNGLDQVTSISGKRIVGVKDGQYGIYSNTFDRLGDEAYDRVCLNDNGLIVVQKEGRWAILDENLQPITDFRFTDVAVNSRGQVFHGNYAVVADEEGYFLIDGKGEAWFDTRFADAKGMEEGLFAVADSSGRWGFADEKGQLVIDCQYEDVLSFSNRLAAVKYAGKWGYINRYNTMVIEAQFEQAFPFLAGKSLVVDDLDNYGILELKYYGLF